MCAVDYTEVMRILRQHRSSIIRDLQQALTATIPAYQRLSKVCAYPVDLPEQITDCVLAELFDRDQASLTKE